MTFLEAVLRARPTSCRSPRTTARPRRDVPPTSAGARAATCAPGTSSWPGRSARAELAALGAEPSPRALRELLALQSSDWAFLITHGTAGDYPRERAAAHLEAFTVALTWTKLTDELRNLAPQLARWAFVQP